MTIFLFINFGLFLSKSSKYGIVDYKLKDVNKSINFFVFGDYINFLM